jgi:hypothetical protein
VAAWTRRGDGGFFSRSTAGRIGRADRLPAQFGQLPDRWPSAQRRQKVHSNVQIIASVDAGGRSTSQHSQLGRSSSTHPVYQDPPGMALSSAVNRDAGWRVDHAPPYHGCRVFVLI